MPVKTQPGDYQTALRDVAKSLVRLKRPERLLKMMTRFLYRQLKLTHVAILIRNPAQSFYTIFDSRGASRLPRSLLRFDLNHPLVRWFREKPKTSESFQGYLVRGSVQSLLRNESTSGKKAQTPEDLSGVERAMGNLRTEIAIPGHVKDSLVGILLLGPKLNGRTFTESGRPIETAFQELRRCAGTQFDPTVVEGFIRAFQKHQRTSRVTS